MEQTFFNIRIFFKKRGRVKYISHLDLNRVFMRALKRSNLPVWYTEGYNPHMYITFALPLSLGYESEHEILDLRLTRNISPETVKRALNAAFPEGLNVTDVALPIMKPSEIAKAEYEIILLSDDPQTLSGLFRDFINREQIIVTKKTKRGFSEIDLKPEIYGVSHSVSFSSDYPKPFLKITIILPAGSVKNINPSLLTSEFLKDNPDIPVNITRTRVLTDKDIDFI